MPSQAAPATNGQAPIVAPPAKALAEFLQPLRIDAALIHKLAQDLSETFVHLAANSDDQFLPTPISQSILSHPIDDITSGPHLAIDIGGTNLRVAFVELAHDAPQDSEAENQPLRRHLEHSWPIGEHLKNENAKGLFAWIGARIAQVVAKACAQQLRGIAAATELPLGVTFSFPMDQETLNTASLRQMGKGFAITSRLDLGQHLLDGYESSRGKLPRIRIAAITNDAVATLLSFMHQFSASSTSRTATAAAAIQRRPVMGLICGTGCNATVFMGLGGLKQSKRPKKVQTLPGDGGGGGEQLSIAVNTEWSINGSAGPLRNNGLVSRWDDMVSAAAEKPGFQPLEYMTAGLYLGEIGRLALVDYLTNVLRKDPKAFPEKLLRRFEPRNTTFLSHFSPGQDGNWSGLVDRLNDEFPTGGAQRPLEGIENRPTATAAAAGFRWTEDMAQALYHIARAIEFRAAGIIAASTVGLLRCSGALPSAAELAAAGAAELHLGVGYTGGCITNFQDYLQHCQELLDELVAREYGDDDGCSTRVRIVLEPCHDGGIDGAGILVPAAVASGI
ncbi:hypothetical protein GGTG_08549 [Gaeumannomyces tritici R3-111a-1]|uniref:Phosphotransferase n=1 Tax=Gaeumannomyces tritici (strain R3-111a-1) TaxID=644352 RepID=J3P4W3_GAET3|nr:hypothetical protein GGTG_08549 [Gaeumannomyces tritici R3-111a-1]EJT74711.1 hypothetical protein GGTG_08549 [Gaeumannomyces tritici R3-111a-1]